MSAQTCFDITVARPFLFLSSLKIFQSKFFPLSHFPLTFHYSIKLKHEVDLKSFLCTWVWTKVGLKSFLSPLQRPFERSSMIFSQVRISLSPSPLSMGHRMIWVLWYNFCLVLVSVLKWVFLHGLIFDLSFFLYFLFYWSAPGSFFSLSVFYWSGPFFLSCGMKFMWPICLIDELKLPFVYIKLPFV